MVNGGPKLQVPDLSTLSHRDPATWAQGVILDGAGVVAGGVARVATAEATYTLYNVEVVVMAMPPMLHIWLTGVHEGEKALIPWHAITSIRPA